MGESTPREFLAGIDGEELYELYAHSISAGLAASPPNSLREYIVHIEAHLEESYPGLQTFSELFANQLENQNFTKETADTIYKGLLTAIHAVTIAAEDYEITASLDTDITD